MKEYTLKEVIDKLERNTNLKFKFVAEGYRTDEGAVIKLNEDGYVVNQEGEPILSNFSLRSRFVLASEPVDRITAFRMFEKGKSIYCLLGGKRFNYYPDKINEFTELVSDQESPISVEEILHGKWFIEEE